MLTNLQQFQFGDLTNEFFSFCVSELINTISMWRCKFLPKHMKLTRRGNAVNPHRCPR
jgi:hypothetical protein